MIQSDLSLIENIRYASKKQVIFTMTHSSVFRFVIGYACI